MYQESYSASPKSYAPHSVVSSLSDRSGNLPIFNGFNRFNHEITRHERRKGFGEQIVIDRRFFKYEEVVKTIKE